MKRDSERWKPNRIIFFNYWYFPNEEYKFRNGRLLIKGHNGAGKSVAMNTVFTFLIDGNKDPKRLDPFESSDRKFYDILLGEESLNKDITERIGYVVVEYKLGDKEEYMTTGIGMHAKRKNRKMEDAWALLFRIAVLIKEKIRFLSTQPKCSTAPLKTSQRIESNSQTTLETLVMWWI